jgi:hypothetical protein
MSQVVNFAGPLPLHPLPLRLCPRADPRYYLILLPDVNRLVATASETTQDMSSMLRCIVVAVSLGISGL